MYGLMRRGWYPQPFTLHCVYLQSEPKLLLIFIDIAIMKCNHHFKAIFRVFDVLYRRSGICM